MRTSSTTSSGARVRPAACDIQILDFRARVTGPAELVRELRELFPRAASLRSLAAQSYAATFDVRSAASDGGAYTISHNGAPLGSAENLQDALASLEWAIDNAAVEELGGQYLLFHAGVVAFARQGVLLPAASGSGKTTLVAGLVAAGFQYLSDEVGALDPLTGRLAPFPKSLCVKAGSQSVLEQVYPQLRHGPSCRRFGGAPMKYLTPAPDAVAAGPVPVRFVILPHYADGAVTALEPITRSEALARLMEQSFSLSAHGVAGMRAVVDMLADAECYTLTIGNLHRGVTLVQALTLRSAPPRSVSGQAPSPPAPGSPSPLPPPPSPASPLPVVPASAPASAGTRRVWFRRGRAGLSGMGLALIAIGALVLVYGTAVQADVLPGAPVTVPRPAALDRPRPPAVNTSIVGVPIASTGSAPTTIGESAPVGSASQVAAVFGWATHLSVPSIGLETEVVPTGMQLNQQGELEWQTVPFVATHYVNTAPVGGPGNAVISGHVATMREGNVFRELNRIDYGDLVGVTSDYGEFTYIVDELELVLPTEVSVMDSTSDSRLTLITCGGTFDPLTRTFDHRLIVISKLVDY